MCCEFSLKFLFHSLTPCPFSSPRPTLFFSLRHPYTGSWPPSSIAWRQCSRFEVPLIFVVKERMASAFHFKSVRDTRLARGSFHVMNRWCHACLFACLFACFCRSFAKKVWVCARYVCLHGCVMEFDCMIWIDYWLLEFWLYWSDDCICWWL